MAGEFPAFLPVVGEAAVPDGSNSMSPIHLTSSASLPRGEENKETHCCQLHVGRRIEEEKIEDLWGNKTSAPSPFWELRSWEMESKFKRGRGENADPKGRMERDRRGKCREDREI